MAAEETREFEPPTLVREPGVPEDSSLLASLRARRELASSARHFDYEVPGYGHCLVLRLGPIPGRQLTQLRERGASSTSPDRDVNANADLLVAACREVLGRRTPDGELTPIDPEGGPVRIEQRLAELLGLKAQSARDVVYGLFDMANNPDFAVGVAVSAYMDWSSAADADVNEGFVGESAAATP